MLVNNSLKLSKFVIKKKIMKIIKRSQLILSQDTGFLNIEYTDFYLSVIKTIQRHLKHQTQVMKHFEIIKVISFISRLNCNLFRGLPELFYLCFPLAPSHSMNQGSLFYYCFLLYLMFSSRV